MFKRASDEFFTALVSRRLRRAGVALGHSPRFVGLPSIDVAKGGRLEIGERFVAVSTSRRQVLGLSHEVVIRVRDGALVTIADDCGMSGATIVAAVGIEIGEGCLIGGDAMIVDTDFHPLRHPARRYAEPPAGNPSQRVLIGRNVFIGARAIILKGTSLGDNAVVGAGSVVSGAFPPNVVIAGNPARVVRNLGEASCEP